MKATLVIPRPPVSVPGGPTINSRAVYRFKLRWTNHHPASNYGLGVLLSPNNEVIDGFMFRFLRERVGARIETDDPERVAGALGIEVEELNEGFNQRAPSPSDASGCGEETPRHRSGGE